jgi:tetratricopeptide (TPR) repeat protein
MVEKQDYKGALEVYREGLKTDRANVELYVGTNQALAILARPASERVETLLAFPDQAGMPTPLAYDLALSLAEAGRIGEAEGVFRNRFFAREEGGTNVREVYVEVQLRKALALAKAGKAAEARAVVARLGKEEPGLEFTRDGMEVFLSGARYEYMLGLVESLLGNDAAAREHWKKASGQRGAFAVMAARRMADNDWRARAEQMVGQAGGRGRGFGGVDRPLLLRLLGREKEAVEQIRNILRGPDRRLSHYYARTAMSDTE